VEEEGDGEENETNVFDGRTLMVYLLLSREEGETEAPYGAASGPSSRRSKKKKKNVHEESDTRHKLLCEDICDLDSEDDNEFF
jgi:hypothetical protein